MDTKEMAVVGNELEIVMAIGERAANDVWIARRLRYTVDYTEYLCRYLRRGGYLSRDARGLYNLTPKGSEALAKQKRDRGHGEQAIQRDASPS